jgi:signal peptidase II
MVLLWLWFVALGSAVLLYRGGVLFQSHTALIGLGAAFGGAAGNLWDILRHGSIPDFIGVGCWPVFNVADIAITAGVFLAFLARS